MATMHFLTVAFRLSLLLVVAVLGFPIWRFMTDGWFRRRYEFANRLNNKVYLPLYRARFWPREHPSFDHIYTSIAGRRYYVVPLLMLAVLVVVLGGMVLATGLRIGYEYYVTMYQGWLTPDDLKAFGLTHYSADDLRAMFTPVTDDALDLASIAAIAGAYLYTVGVVIQGYRTRSLTSTDLLWCDFRLVIALPMGLSLAAFSPEHIGAFLSFALGAFPIDALTAMLRRVVNTSLHLTEDNQSTDRVVFLSGVTPDVAGLLNAEGILAVPQLASVDPVSLAIRTGLSFDYVLNLVAQAQAWSFLGDTTPKLAPLGLGDARPIAAFVSRMASVAQADIDEVTKILQAAESASGVDAACLKILFQRIAADDYTTFLVHFAPGHGS